MILSPVLTGTALVLITLLAYARSSLTLPGYEDPGSVSAAVWRSAEDQAGVNARDQLLRLGTFAAVAAVAFGLTALRVRRGTRRPTLLLAVAAGLTAVYVAVLWQLFFERLSIPLIVPDGAEPSHVVVVLRQPGWYDPLRGVLLVVGAVAQVQGLLLLTGGRGVSWLTRHGGGRPVEGESPPLWMSPHRQAGVLMSITPALLLVYAAVNYAGCLAGLAEGPGEPELLPRVFLLDMRAHARYLAIPAVPVVLGGLILLFGRGNGRPWAGLMSGVFGLPYAAALLESGLHYSDTSMFHNYVATEVETPWWNQLAIATAGTAVFLLHLASLALLFRAPVLRTR